MSSTQHVHITTRHSPPHLRKPARSAPSSKGAGTPKIGIKGAKATKRAKAEDDDIFEDDSDDMGSSFLQFCAMCEKQIVVPNSSILYCSESCRHRDSIIPSTHPYLTLALNSPSRMTPSTFSFDNDDPFGARLPMYVPHGERTLRSFHNDRIPSKTHDGKSDLDPTEWKPAEPCSTGIKPPEKEWKPKLVHRPSSEAFSYLSKFHHSTDSIASKRRPTLGHGRSTTRTTPPLSHTPTPSASSEESLVGTPYDFVGRPAINMPIATTMTPVPEGINEVKDVGGLTYEKKHVGAGLGSATGSLKKLLATATPGM